MRAINEAGGRDATPALQTFTVDATPPETTITSGPSGETPDDTPTFEFLSSEQGSRFECSVDGGTFSPCSSPTTFGPLGDGDHTFRVKAIDEAGNSDLSPDSKVFTVCTLEPGACVIVDP